MWKMSQNDSLRVIPAPWCDVCGFNIILPVKLSTHVSCYEWPFLSNVKRPCKWMHILCMMLHIVCDWDVTWKDGCWPFTICEIYHFSCNAWLRKLFNGALKFNCLALSKYILILNIWSSNHSISQPPVHPCFAKHRVLQNTGNWANCTP